MTRTGWLLTVALLVAGCTSSGGLAPLSPQPTASTTRHDSAPNIQGRKSGHADIGEAYKSVALTPSWGSQAAAHWATGLLPDTNRTLPSARQIWMPEGWGDWASIGSHVLNQWGITWNLAQAG